MAKDPDDPSDPRSSWPRFLDLLDRDRDRAFALFYEFFMRSVKARPPKSLRYFPREEREDALRNVLLKFAERDFRRLRMYKDTGTPFVGWMYVVCNNLLDTEWKHRKEELTRRVDDHDWDQESSGQQPPPPPPNDEVQKLLSEVLEKLGSPCNVLLVLKFVDGKPNRELVRIFTDLGYDNRQIDVRIRGCLQKMLRMIRDRGLDRDRFRDFLED